jgi:hypothetical protein
MMFRILSFMLLLTTFKVVRRILNLGASGVVHRG